MMMSSSGNYIVLFMVIYNNIQTGTSSTGHVQVPSCGATNMRKVDCGFNTKEECPNSDCCWDSLSEPPCFKKEIRQWDVCSAKCRHPGKPGMRKEVHRGWTMPCHTFPCQLNTACTCQRIDVVFIVDASKSVREINFWARKQFMIDVIKAYKQIGHDTRFALITYDNTPKVIFDFAADHSLDDVAKLSLGIWKMQYQPGSQGKYLSSALLKAAEIVEEQGREDVQHIGLVISDGKVTKDGQIPAAVHTLRESGTIIHVAHNRHHNEDEDEVDHDEEMLMSLVESKLHLFTSEDYNHRSDLINALVTEWCCQGGLKNTLNAKFDDTGDIYLNGEYKEHVLFKETAVVMLKEGQNNLIALRVKNILNPDGRFFEVWNTAHVGISMLSLPFQWRCTHREYPGWYGMDFDDSRWELPVVAPREKDHIYVGARGQKRLWTSTGNWTSYCRGWSVAWCNVTYMPGVKCQSTGSIMGYGVCENTFDGQVSGRGGEWITNHATLPTITIDFNRKAKIHEIGILNRCSFNGQAKDLSIEFSDKSVHAMTLACNAYSKMATHCNGVNWSHMTFDPPFEARWMKITILSACDGNGKRKGLREIQVLGHPPCY